MALTASTAITDATLFVRDLLISNLTDVLSPARASASSWVFTAYPEDTPKYPIVTVECDDVFDERPAGMQSEAMITQYVLKVRVWAKKVNHRDKLAQQVYNILRTKQLDTGGTVEYGLLDFKLLSSINIDVPGTDGEHSRVMRYQYRVVMTG